MSMKKALVSVLLFAFLLTACSGAQESGSGVQMTETAAIGSEQPITVTEAPAETQAPTAVVPEPTSQEPAEPTDEPQKASQPGGASDSVIIFRIMPEESRVTYEVDETFLDFNRLATAVGVTQGIEGQFELDPANPQRVSLGPVTIDISQFTSDNSRRDRAIRDRYLQSAQFPLAVFETTAIAGLPASIQDGVDYPVTITGNLTIREVTRPVTFDTVVRMESDRISGQAKTTILMSDFGFGPISIAGMLNTEDEVQVTFDFVARPVG
jgi:polyisoprenoid-binding protein YceI/predicted small secreted protein